MADYVHRLAIEYLFSPQHEEVKEPSELMRNRKADRIFLPGQNRREPSPSSPPCGTPATVSPCSALKAMW